MNIFSKHITLPVLLILGSIQFIFAQETAKHFDIKVIQQKIKSGSNSYLSSFRFNDSQFQTDLMLPYVNGEKHIKKTIESIEVINQDWQELPFKISKNIVDNVLEKEELEYFVGEERKNKVLHYSIKPYKKVNDKIFYLKSFDLKINYGHSYSSKTAKSNSFNSNSILRSGNGDWFKFAILNDGIYKITYEMLEEIGVDIGNISSSSLNIYGNGTGLLSEVNSDFRHDDLTKNAIKVVDGGDGQFSSGDYILFYANGPNRKIYQGGTLVHQTHIYSDSSFYFLNINPTESPKRILNQIQSSSSITKNITTFDELKYYEQDRVNLLTSGRKWFGDHFDVLLTQSYQFSFPNINTSVPVRLKFVAIGRSFNSSTNYRVQELNSGFSQLTSNISNTNPSTYAVFAKEVNETFSYSPSSGEQDIKITYNRSSSPEAEGWLDYIEVLANRNLIMTGNQMIFSSLSSVGLGDVSKFSLSGASSVSEIWDITDCRNVSSINYSDLGSVKEFVVSTDSLKTFLAIGSNTNFSQPIFSKKVKPQNLHALNYADLIIIAPEEFYSNAEELKNVHEDLGHSVYLVKDEEVYNEFSSGSPDATAIKHFMKMFYDRASTANDIPKHLLLFGNGSYDNKDRTTPNSNYIITYQSEESYEPTATFTSDDYFVTLSDNESFTNKDLIDMGVGRFPVRTNADAEAAIKKVINYTRKGSSISSTEGAVCSNGEVSSPLGDWRTYVGLVADDEDFSGFIDDSENVYDRIMDNNPEINVQKIYLDLYQQESTAGGQRYPQAKEDLRQRVQNGCLILNFVGHGGPPGWTSERILNTTMVTEWSNFDKLPVFMTATCQFSRYDDPGRVSGGELTFLNPDGGAIAMFTTTRVVFDSSNGKIVNRFFDSVLHRKNKLPKDLGEIYMTAKNSFANAFDDKEFRKFSLLGDPALRLALPQHDVELSHVNNKMITDPAVDTLKALSKMEIKGFVKDQNGTKLTNFNGVTYVTVFDKKKSVQNRQNDEKSSLRTFDVQNNILFKGKATVKNGEFVSTFVVPKDIDYQFGKGKFSFYSENSVQDAIGYSDSIVVGGFDENAPEDHIGPTIKLFINDSTFVFGGLTDENPLLIAEIFDENGINTVGSGIGHDISAIIDYDQSNPIILNDFYESDIDTYQSGKLRYLMSDLEPGTHTLTLKVWDVYNNSSEKTIEFTVVEKEEMAIDHVLNYPNPFTTNTQFMFEHNQACSFLRVKVEVFTVSGKLVKNIKRTIKTEGFRAEPITWNGRDDFGDKIARGVYIYKLTVETPSGEKAEKYEKLVILN